MLGIKLFILIKFLLQNLALLKNFMKNIDNCYNTGKKI